MLDNVRRPVAHRAAARMLTYPQAVDYLYTLTAAFTFLIMTVATQGQFIPLASVQDVPTDTSSRHRRRRYVARSLQEGTSSCVRAR